MSRSTSTVSMLGAAAVLMLAAACGASTATSGGGGGATPSVPGGVLGVATTSLGPVLVDGKGFTVYVLTADTPEHSTCSAECLKFWPVVAAPAGSGVPAVKGVSSALASTKATSGASMVTVAGRPLYKFVQDTAPGEVAGEGAKSFGGTWYAVSPSGKPVTAPATSAPATTSSGGSGGGGGYGY